MTFDLVKYVLSRGFVFTEQSPKSDFFSLPYRHPIRGVQYVVIVKIGFRPDITVYTNYSVPQMSVTLIMDEYH